MDLTPALLVREPVFSCDHGSCVWHGVPHPVPYHRDADGRMWPIDLRDVECDSDGTGAVTGCER